MLERLFDSKSQEATILNIFPCPIETMYRYPYASGPISESVIPPNPCPKLSENEPQSPLPAHLLS